MKKTVLITGSSTGIGKATARYFAEMGWNVAATMRNPENVTDLTDSDSFRKLKLDVQSRDSISNAISNAISVFGRIDVVVNNAGYGTYGPLEVASDDQIRRQFDVNIFGVLDVIREILPHFRENKSGTIINVSSVGGKITTPLGSLYHGTKWGIEGISEALNYELNPIGIYVKLVEPGGVKTDFAGRSLDIIENNIPEYDQVVKSMTDVMSNPNMIRGKAENVAKVIFKAATGKKSKMRYISGTDAKIMISVKQILGARAVRGMMKKMAKIK